MPLNSYGFLFLFLPVTGAGVWLLSRISNRSAIVGWLLLTSIFFYGYASLPGLLCITPCIALDYCLAKCLLRIHPSQTRLRTSLLFVGISVNVLFLGYFKYKNFFIESVNATFATHFELSSLILPLGVSFITFQNIAFLCEVGADQIKSIRLVDFLLFAFFFPRAIAGPITHYNEVVPQFRNIPSRAPVQDFCVAACLLSIGLFKKGVIADPLAQYVDPAFNFAPADPPDFFTAWTGVLAYTFQLYFDFSGYSDIALGVARLFGVQLPMNFNSPLRSRGIIEFWSRWHITLTRFLTTYVYTPLLVHLTRARQASGKAVLRAGKSSASAVGILVWFPIMATMSISGLWHGAGWQFIVWGLIHGTYLAINQTWRLFRRRIWSAHLGRITRPLCLPLTFGCVTVAFAFFRADSVSTALSILHSMTGAEGLMSEDSQLYFAFALHHDWNLLLSLCTPVLWIVVLFCAVTLLPNSLELLRGYHPAVNFPEDPNNLTDPRERPAELNSASKDDIAIFRGIRRLWANFSRIRETGVMLDGRVWVILTALMFVFGLSALAHSDAFLYFKF